MSKMERAARTRETIVHAAAVVFEEHGFHGSRLTAITKQSGLTMGAIYFHFASKEELARAVMNEQANDLELPGGVDGLQRLVDITMYLADQLRVNALLRAGVRLAVEQRAFGMRDETPYVSWAEQFREQLVAARAAGDLLPEVDEADLSLLLVSAYSGTQLVSELSSGREDLPERILVMWRYLLPGVATPQARARLRLSTELTDAVG
ncbi:TetR/AcrR family transcriptional regulator [Streptomyces sp. ISL-66]|uniref:ScbR family autoregulator-binding transcription factor n=1 Tax=Streptomyces sp. ISL-66 TaxID=2819186 RepID=UPI001BEA46BA|nr:ScbR family autoregulator-binding transcription factor [Streptomyces sp. ISL-66]MBT2472878.1 TetR/AcrR family transcriptional regulator [Streptomyces sp. ISL-66]